MATKKVDVALNWIGHGVVRVAFDGTHPGVVLPKKLRSKVRVELDVGLDLPKPIPDLKLDADGVSGTLSFADFGLFFCYVPWQAVFAIGSRALDKAEFWLNDAPRSVQNEILEKAGERANAKVRRKTFRVLPGGKSSASKRKRGAT